MANTYLRVAIVDAGMGGLASALALAKKGFKHIEVCETASDLGFVGAGIQLAPNMRETLTRSWVTWNPTRSLFEACEREDGVKFFFSSAAEDVDIWSPRPSFKVRPRGGEPYPVTADILIAAHGLKSNIRARMLRELKVEANIQDTGQAAYRIMLKREEMQHDPELLELIDGNRVTRWIGEKRHIIAYPVSGKQIYNLSTAQPDTNFAAGPSTTYTTKGSKQAMLDTFSNFWREF